MNKLSSVKPSIGLLKALINRDLLCVEIEERLVELNVEFLFRKFGVVCFNVTDRIQFVSDAIGSKYLYF